MTQEKIKIGLVGTGRIGAMHAEHLCHRIHRADLVAIVSRSQANAERLAETLGVSKASDQISTILDDPEIDAVAICSSTDTHSEFIIRAAEAGKHIFCEKPIDLDLDRVDRALAAVRSAGVKLQIGFHRRFDPNFQEVEQQVRNGAVGELNLVRITSRDPGPPPLDYIKTSGGLFLDMSIHDFDMARFLVGSEVEEVFAKGTCRTDPAIGEAGDVDTAVIVLIFKNGCMVTIDNCRKASYGYDQRVEVFGSKGMAWADNNTPHRTGLGNAEGMHTSKPLDFFLERYVDAYLAQMNAFIDSVLKGEEPSVTGIDGRNPVVIALAAKRSMEQGRPVLLSEIEK